MAAKMTSAERKVALLRLHAAVNGSPEPSRAMRRAAAKTVKRKGRPARGA